MPETGDIQLYGPPLELPGNIPPGQRWGTALSGLNFFSSEIVKNVHDRFIAIDYVNDMCDMRIASLHRDGVPDRVVKKIAGILVEWAAGN